MDYHWDFKDTKAYNNKTGFYKTKTQLKFIVNNSKNKFERILDIGGGAGRFAIPLLTYSKDITVIDVNETAIRLLNERSKNISTICGDFIQTKLTDQYSLILCIEATAYFPDWEKLFNKINSLLKDDGRFIFTYTNPNSWRFLLRKIKNLNKPHPFTEMNFVDFKKLLKENNFEIKKIKGMNWIPLPVTSNSVLVPFFELIEKKLGLNNWRSQSPWLLISARKMC